MTCIRCAGKGTIGKYEFRCSQCYGTGSGVPLVQYAGIGSRETPLPVMMEMESIGMQLALRGFVLRSGGAKGADTAFERGCDALKGRKTIRVATILKSALDHAAQFHPNWDACDTNAKGLHSRNSLVMLGDWLDTPVNFAVCWTPGGQVTGGTGQALRIAAAYNIPVFNLAVTPVDAIWQWLGAQNVK